MKDIAASPTAHRSLAAAPRDLRLLPARLVAATAILALLLTIATAAQPSGYVIYGEVGAFAAAIALALATIVGAEGR